MTINVPRELLADLLGNDHDKRIMAERHLLAMLANAPLPAGVDGLGDMLSSLPAGMEVISAKRLSERIRPNVEAAPWVCDEVKRLESIIDSLHVGAELRVEAVLSADRTVRHHQAQWIDTLGGLLRDARKYLAPGAVRSRIDAALSGIKEPQ